MKFVSVVIVLLSCVMFEVAGDCENCQKKHCTAKNASVVSIDKAASKCPVTGDTIGFVEEARDIGTVELQSELNLQFRFVNPTDDEITIKSVRRTCSCLTIQGEWDGHKVPPQSCLIIPVQMNTGSRYTPRFRVGIVLTTSENKSYRSVVNGIAGSLTQLETDFLRGLSQRAAKQLNNREVGAVERAVMHGVFKAVAEQGSSILAVESDLDSGVTQVETLYRRFYTKLLEQFPETENDEVKAGSAAHAN